MRIGLFLCLSILLCVSATGKKVKKSVERPTQFEMGVLTFFDFGPPFQYYGLYVVQPAEDGARIERMILTPEGDKCFAPAKIEKATATVHETVDQLLGARNPCEIPEKELKRELKRCKHCTTFSGANVTMQVSCSGETRLIRSDILDRGMFGAAKTPTNTNWTMSLVSDLDKAVGPGVMDKPMFSNGNEPVPQPITDEEGTILKAMAAGSFDSLFLRPTPKLSDLYKETQLARVAHPDVTIKEIVPRTPDQLILPKYSPLTLLTHVQGTVTANFTILDDGQPSWLTMQVTGMPLLRGVVEDTLRKWRFPKDAAGEQEQVTFEFLLNCPN